MWGVGITVLLASLARPAAAHAAAHDPLPAVDASGTLNVSILLMPGIFISEATIPFDMYKHVPDNKTNVYFVAETMDPVTTYYGTRLKPDFTFDTAPMPDILVVGSGIGSHHSFLTSWYGGVAGENGVVVGKTTNDQNVTYYGNMSSLIGYVRNASAAAKIVTSHCWGAFTLADAGILDGKTVTTFPGYTATLKQHYPNILAVVDDQRFVVDGKLVTSNGAVAAFEASQYVIKHLYGQTVADSIASGLVFSPQNIGHSSLEYYKPSPAAGTITGAGSVVLKVGILLLDGAFISEPVGPFDVFAHMGSSMQVYFVGETMGPILTYYGATMYPDYTIANAPAPDVVVVPSGRHSRGSDQNKTAVISWLQSTAATATWVTSHCWGAFMLGKAGLLDGIAATTFPGYFQELRDQFPAIGMVVEDKRIVRQGKVVTSNGGVAAYEAPNYILYKQYGDYWAKKVALGLVFSEDNYQAAMDAYEGTGPMKVAVLVMDGIFVSEATIPFEVYKNANMTTYFVGETMEPVHTYYGTRLKPHYTFANAPTADIVVIGSGIGSHYTFLNSWYGGTTDANGVVTGKTTKGHNVTYYGNMSSLISWVQSASASAHMVTSHCWGAFTLADAGILNGLTATTFPGYTDTLKAHYPSIAAVVDDQRYVTDGKVMTSNGALAVYEACLAVVKYLYGETVASAVATKMNLSPDNIGHASLQFYRPSPVATADAPNIDGTMKVGILLLQGTHITEAIAPFDVYAHMGAAMEVFFVGESMDPVETPHGAMLYPDYALENATSVDVLVVPGGNASETTDLDKVDVVRWLKAVAANATWLEAIGQGVLLLGKAELLDGKAAGSATVGASETPLPAYVQAFLEGKRIVRDGNFVTSLGGVASYEAANYVVLKQYNETWAKKVATGLVFAKDNYDAAINAHDVAISGTGSSTNSAGTEEDTSGCPGLALGALSLLPALLLPAAAARA